ncbi:MAG: hypothetical protein O2945_08900 [Planctomycetota bacterium]|nr:hypothetical protein [Planctomycetota bacterium]MDA0919175.1 hypothetical protein [Planctomycetota bacterium]
MADPRDAVPGVIHPDDVYRLDEFLNRMQWGKHAWQTARRRGLKPCYAGGRAYVRGADLIRHLDAVQDNQPEVDPNAQAELQALIAALRSHDYAAARTHLDRLNDVHGIGLTLATKLPLEPHE